MIDDEWASFPNKCLYFDLVGRAWTSKSIKAHTMWMTPQLIFKTQHQRQQPIRAFQKSSGFPSLRNSMYDCIIVFVMWFVIHRMLLTVFRDCWSMLQRFQSLQIIFNLTLKSRNFTLNELNKSSHYALAIMRAYSTLHSPDVNSSAELKASSCDVDDISRMNHNEIKIEFQAFNRSLLSNYSHYYALLLYNYNITDCEKFTWNTEFRWK